MRTLGLYALILLASFSTPAFSAVGTAGLQVTKPIYQWKTESNDDKNGFNHCLVKNMYDNGTMMILAQNHDSMTRLALHFPQKKMRPNQQFDLTIQVDKRDIFPVEAVAVNDQILTIGIPDALPDQMRKGDALYLRGPTDEVIFTLDGINGAVTALRDCVTANLLANDVIADKSMSDKKVPDDLLDGDGFVPDKAVPTKEPEQRVAINEKAKSPVMQKLVIPKKETLPKAVKKAEDKPKEAATPDTKPVVKKVPPAKKVDLKKTPVKKAPVVKEAEVEKPVVIPTPLLPKPYDTIIANAQLMPDTLILGQTGQAGNKPLDYAWNKNGLFIGIKKLQGMQVASVQLPQLTTHYLSQLRARCTGEFVAEASSFDRLPRLDNGGWILAEIACAPKDGQKETVGALLFIGQRSHTSVYFVEGSATQASEAIKARNALLNATLRTNIF